METGELQVVTALEMFRMKSIIHTFYFFCCPVFSWCLQHPCFLSVSYQKTVVVCKCQAALHTVSSLSVFFQQINYDIKSLFSCICSLKSKPKTKGKCYFWNHIELFSLNIQIDLEWYFYMQLPVVWPGKGNTSQIKCFFEVAPLWTWHEEKNTNGNTERQGEGSYRMLTSPVQVLEWGETTIRLYWLL